MTACLQSVLVSYRLGNICFQKQLYCLWTKKKAVLMILPFLSRNTSEQSTHSLIDVLKEWPAEHQSVPCDDEHVTELWSLYCSVRGHSYNKCTQGTQDTQCPKCCDYFCTWDNSDSCRRNKVKPKKIPSNL